MAFVFLRTCDGSYDNSNLQYCNFFLSCTVMAISQPRLLVVDQSLRGFEGHHYEYDLAVLRAASTRGLTASLAAHRDFTEPRLGNAPVVARFDTTWSDSRRSFPLAAKIICAVPATVLVRLAPVVKYALTAWQQRKPVTPAIQFASRLSSIIDAEGLTTDDHVFVHTLSEQELLGLSHIFRKRNDLPRLHIMLRYEASITAITAQRCQAEFDGCPELSDRLKYWTDSELLAAHFRDAGIRIDVLPIPHCLPASPRTSLPVDPQEPLVISYLGDARSEKGYDLLPGLVADLAKEFLEHGAVRFLIQSNSPISLERGRMVLTRRKLERYPSDWVELVHGPLPPERFHMNLLSSDLLLLPYKAENYRYRSSGLLAQAVAGGIPTVVPAGTWLSSFAPPDAHVAFGEGLSLANAVREAIHFHPELLAAARLASASVQNENNASLLIAKILEG